MSLSMHGIDTKPLASYACMFHGCGDTSSYNSNKKVEGTWPRKARL